jgi:putative endopeptidase
MNYKNFNMKKFLVQFSVSCFLVVAVSCNCFHCNDKSSGKDELITHIDSTVKPCDDFFHFANGKWFKENPIPPSEQNNGIFLIISDTVNAQVRKICESSSALINSPKGSIKQKIGDFYYSGMDSISLNARGISDLKNEFGKIDAVSDIQGLVEAVLYQYKVAGSPMFDFQVGPDDKNSNKNVIAISQGGLSLPDRNYYFDKDQKAVDIRKKFVAHLENAFKIIGYTGTKAKNAAENLMKLETAIAASCRKREDTRDPWKNYNKVPYKALVENSPNFDWNLFTTGCGLHNIDSVIVRQPEFLISLNKSLKTFAVDDWKNYLKYQLLHSLAWYLDDKTYLDFFNFYAKTLHGVIVPKPRWKRVAEETNSSLGELIGQVYVSEYLPKGTKGKLIEIGTAIKRVYAERIKKLDWMSSATKQKALIKLNSMIMKVGNPDKWKDLNSLQTDRSSYVKNVMRATIWGFEYNMAKYGKPVDRTEWFMEPQTYNAYYNPSNNEIVVPGCNIIVPGYERKLADDALLYSIIGGSTFGHEMTHGFDDQGCKYDEFGNLHNWWTAEDSIKFYTKTKMIVKQFNNYIAVDSLHINGELTQGENIADLGGIMMGYEAFQKTKQYNEHEIIAGLNPDQRFFLGYALAWMVNERPEAIANQVRSNEHSPSQFRVVGPLSNMPEFYATFGIKKGDAMWREDSLRVKIW